MTNGLSGSVGDESAAAGVSLDQPLFAKRLYGLAYSGSADPEALSEFERCEKRKGEATALLLDDTPSFRYYSTLPYWKARAQQDLGQREAAAAGYKAFIALKAGGPRDALVVDARKRLGE